MDKFKNKYRIPSARLQSWDYGANGAYFITICTQHRQHLFGEIVNGTMQLNELGHLAEKYWMEIPQHFPFIKLGNFVVMPNHTHGILIVDKIDIVNNVGVGVNVETRLIASLRPQPSLPPQPSPPHPSLPPKTEINGGFSGTKNPMFHKNISRIIRWYKGRCAFEMRQIHADFGWQSRFYDHIIRDAKSFETIQNYIINNPAKWAEDKFYNKNV